MEQLETTLNENQYVSCIKVGEEHFFDFGKLEDSIYKQTPLSGNTKKYQMFYSEETAIGVLFAKHSNSDTGAHPMDLKRGNDAQRTNVLSTFDVDNMARLDAPGIRAIKQVELYTKWRKHVPDNQKSPLYDNPGDDVLLSVKEDRKSKKKYAETRRLLQEEAQSSGKLASQKTSAVQKASTAKRKAPPKAATTAIKAPPTKKTKKVNTAKGKKQPEKKKK